MVSPCTCGFSVENPLCAPTLHPATHKSVGKEETEATSPSGLETTRAAAQRPALLHPGLNQGSLSRQLFGCSLFSYLTPTPLLSRISRSFSVDERERFIWQRSLPVHLQGWISVAAAVCSLPCGNKTQSLVSTALGASQLYLMLMVAGHVYLRCLTVR